MQTQQKTAHGGLGKFDSTSQADNAKIIPLETGHMCFMPHGLEYLLRKWKCHQRQQSQNDTKPQSLPHELAGSTQVAPPQHLAGQRVDQNQHAKTETQYRKKNNARRARRRRFQIAHPCQHQPIGKLHQRVGGHLRHRWRSKCHQLKHGPALKRNR